MANSDTADWSIVLEYELPRERGRRPDAVVLTPGTAIVLEFKGASAPLRADLDQVRAYARELPRSLVTLTIRARGRRVPPRSAKEHSRAR